MNLIFRTIDLSTNIEMLTSTLLSYYNWNENECYNNQKCVILYLKFEDF